MPPLFALLEGLIPSHFQGLRAFVGGVVKDDLHGEGPRTGVRSRSDGIDGRLPDPARIGDGRDHHGVAHLEAGDGHLGEPHGDLDLVEIHELDQGGTHINVVAHLLMAGGYLTRELGKDRGSIEILLHLGEPCRGTLELGLAGLELQLCHLVFVLRDHPFLPQPLDFGKSFCA